MAATEPTRTRSTAGVEPPGAPCATFVDRPAGKRRRALVSAGLSPGGGPALQVTVNSGGETADMAMGADGSPGLHTRAASPRLLDLLDIATVAYTAGHLQCSADDVQERPYDEIHMPVRDAGFWQGMEAELAVLLYMLTGDGYTFVFSGLSEGMADSSPVSRPIDLSQPADCVALISGGLDSFATAAALRDEGRTPLLVSHTTPNEAVSQAQEHVAACLARAHDSRAQSMSMRCEITPQLPDRDENDTRRSTRQEGTEALLHMAIGAVACEAAEATTVCYATSGHAPPADHENAVACVARSRRAALPMAMRQLNELLEAAGTTVRVENPVAYKTKAELIQQHLRPRFSDDDIQRAVSCVSAGQHAWPCGECAKCVSRAVAVTASGIAPRRHARDPMAANPSSMGSHHMAELLQLVTDVRELDSGRWPRRFDAILDNAGFLCAGRSLDTLRRLAGDVELALSVAPDARRVPATT